MLMLMIMMVFQRETHLINIASQEIKYFNVLIKNKSFFEQLNKKKTNKKCMNNLLKNNDFSEGNLLFVPSKVL